MQKITVYSKSRGLRTLKEGVTLEEYQRRVPDAIKVKIPSLRALHRQCTQGISKTPCGCRVEPDGECHHGRPSWLSILGMV